MVRRAMSRHRHLWRDAPGAVAYASAASHSRFGTDTGQRLALAHQYASLVGRALVEDGEAQRLEFCRGLRAPEIRMKGCGVGIVRFCGESHGIDDRRVRVIWEYADDLNVLIGVGIGLIDDADWRLAARDTQQGRTHVRGLRDPVSNARPDIELLECRLGVLAGRNTINIGQGEITTADELGQVKSLFDLDRLRLVPASNQHDAVTEQVHPAFRLDQLFLLNVVHPIQVSRDEDLRWGVLLDLFGERRACRIGDRGFFAGLFLPFGIDGIERIFEARGCEYHDIALRLSRWWRRAPSHRCGGRQGRDSANQLASTHHHHLLTVEHYPQGF